MACFYCKGNLVEGVTVFTVQLPNCLVVIRNVPCIECEQCGEVEISDDVMQQVEHIVAACQALVQEVAVVDYRMAA